MSKLKLMMKNLHRGLSKGALLMESKTWPGTPEFALLLTIKMIWPTSDRDHSVVSPTRLLMGAYLGLGRVRCFKDLVSGVFLCSLFYQYEELSKRFVPEATNFLVAALLHLAPHPYERANVPGFFPILDFNLPACRTLRLSDTEIKSLNPSVPHLTRILTAPDENVAQNKVDVLGTVFVLLKDYAELWKDILALLELYGPILTILESIRDDCLSPGLLVSIFYSRVK